MHARGCKTVLIVPCLLVFLLSGQSLRGQTSTPQRVYSSQSNVNAGATIGGFTKDGASGGLNGVAGSPFPERLEGGKIAIDGQGRFLFVLNPTSNNISMFQIDSSTGALTEVPHSPFTSGPTINPNQAPSAPISITGEKSGKYLYVGYSVGNISTMCAITPYAIDAANLQLTLTPGLSMDVDGNPIQLISDSKGLRLYAGLDTNPNEVSALISTTYVYSIDPDTGALYYNGRAGSGGQVARSFAIDPKDRFYFDGHGWAAGYLASSPISPVDGTTQTSNTIEFDAGDEPYAMLADTSGKFLYVRQRAGVFLYLVDQTTGVLSLGQGPLSGITFSTGTAVSDPAGPYVYSLYGPGVHGYQVDQQTGALTELAGSPFGTAFSGSYLTISGSGTQNVSGPAAAVFPISVDFGQVTISQTSATKIVSLTNTGDQLLTIGAMQFTGTNSADFSKTTTCGATLAANDSCSISLLFQPTVAGPESATLQVNTNAPSSPQSVPLTGSGATAYAAVTLSPSGLSFAALAQGETSPAQTLTITNSGSAPLHISNIALSGANVGDFSFTPSAACNSAIAVQGSCTVTATFSPQAPGQRTANLTITDDAPGSPQNASLSGAGATAFQMSAAGSGTTSQTVSSGQTAQYALQLTPGPGFTGMVALSCSGAPAAASCTVSPSSLSIANGAAAPFTVSVTTTGNSGATTHFWQETPYLQGILLLLSGALFAVLIRKTKRSMRPMTAGFSMMAAAVILSCAAGCGGGTSASVPPPHLVTPPGVSTITVTATSGSLPPQTIALSLTVR